MVQVKFFFKCLGNRENIKEIFYDEIKRIFLIDKNDEWFSSHSLSKYIHLIERLNEDNDSIKDKNEFRFFWDLLFLFIENLNKYIVTDKVCIILEQYRPKI